MNQQEKEKLIEQWLQGRVSDDELLESITKEEVEQYKLILDTVDNWEPAGSSTIAGGLKKILSAEKEAKVVKMRPMVWIASLAASLVLIAVFVFIFNNQEVEYYAENENLEVLLPDNSTTVILSPGSSLSYSKKFSKQSRKVKVKGRAYFDVTEKGAFEVDYGTGSIAVLGTQFEVIAFEDLFEASCFEGVVQVSHRGRTAKIRARDRVIYVKGSLEKSQVNVDAPAWLDQEEERFENDRLIKVIKVLETRYKVEVAHGDIDLDRRFTGSIPIDDLQQACRKVFAPLGINFTIEDRKVILSE